MKVICWEGKVMVSGGIMKDGVCESYLLVRQSND